MSPEASIALSRLPHREPFRFVSRVESLEAGVRGRAIWTIDGSEDFFRGHFPGDPIVPGVLLSEALAQLSGLVGLQNGGSNSGRLVHIDVRFDDAVRPPAEVILSSTLIRTLGDLRQFDVKAEVAGRTVARGTLALAPGAKA
jgi:3-hydroxyacyl-[acyl-carrier-protein] dehydratase